MYMRREQKGIVSITVTLILMLVISLIVIGFAQVSRREQRQALDRQLSTQAFFAAESGVNEAIEAIRSASAGQSLEKDTCGPQTSGTYSGIDSYDINTRDQVSYTCLLVSTEQPTIEMTLENDGTASTFQLDSKNNAMTQLSISWKPANLPYSSAGCSTSGAPTALPRADGSWNCDYGLVRLDLVPTSGNIRRGSTTPGDGLLGSQKAFFLYPSTATAAGVNFQSTPGGSIRNMHCDNTECRATIIGLAAGTEYGLRAMAVYAGGKLVITAEKSDGSPEQLLNAQAQIDVTGKAQDVLRRVQVRVPLNGNKSLANNALESGSSICKRFGIGPGQFSISGISGQDQSNPMCKPIAFGLPPAPAVVPAVANCSLFPADVMLLIDNSGTMSQDRYAWEGRIRLDWAKQYANMFVDELSLTGLGVNAGAVSFNETAGLVQALTSDSNLLKSRINGIDGDNGTYLKRGLVAAHDALRASNRPGAIKHIVFISDADAIDDSNEETLAYANDIKSAGYRIYAIAITPDAADTAILKQIGSGTNGFYYPAAQVSTFDQALRQIAKTVTCK